MLVISQLSTLEVEKLCLNFSSSFCVFFLYSSVSYPVKANCSVFSRFLSPSPHLRETAEFPVLAGDSTAHISGVTALGGLVSNVLKVFVSYILCSSLFRVERTLLSYPSQPLFFFF